MSDIITAVIVDDEVAAVSELLQLCENYSDIRVLQTFTDPKDAISFINSNHPRLVFLDIQMPLIDGFAFLQYLTSQPYVVFVTAHDEYAIKAFEAHSVDYVLKPILPERFDKTIARIRDLVLKEKLHVSFARLYASLDSLDKKNEPVYFKASRVGNSNTIDIIRSENVVRFYSKDKYVYLVTSDATEYYYNDTLKNIVSKNPWLFLRISDNCIVNVTKIKSIDRPFLRGKYFIILNTTPIIKLAVTETYRKGVLAWLDRC